MAGGVCLSGFMIVWIGDRSGALSFPHPPIQDVRSGGCVFPGFVEFLFSIQSEFLLSGANERANL